MKNTYSGKKEDSSSGGSYYREDLRKIHFSGQQLWYFSLKPLSEELHSVMYIWMLHVIYKRNDALQALPATHAFLFESTPMMVQANHRPVLLWEGGFNIKNTFIVTF